MSKILFKKWLSGEKLSNVARICIVVSPILLLVYIGCVLAHHYVPSFHLWSLTNFGVMGDFVGGMIGTLMATAAALYVIKTYLHQIKQDSKNDKKTAILHMIKLHKENVDQLRIVSMIGGESQTYEGRYIFPILFQELQFVYDKTFTAINQFLTKNNDVRYNAFREYNTMVNLALRLSYGFYFYDLSYHLTRDKNLPLYDITKEVVAILTRDQAMNYYKSLHRNIVLSHYYRHLFNMVKFVDDSRSELKFKEREQLCIIIRSQLSDYEQVLLYYNVLSPLGVKWIEPLGKNEVDEMCLLCKYRLIKNIPCYISYFGKDPASVFRVEDKAWRDKDDKFFEVDMRLDI